MKEIIMKYRPYQTEVYQKMAIKSNPDIARLLLGEPFHGIEEAHCYDDGSYEIETLVYGLMHGMRRNYYPNGQLHFVDAFSNNYQIGFSIQYDKNGEFRHFAITEHHFVVKSFSARKYDFPFNYFSYLEGDEYFPYFDLDSIADQNQREYYENYIPKKLLKREKNKEMMKAKGVFDKQNDLDPFYSQQIEYKKQVITEDMFTNDIRYIAGVDVAYNELELRMVGGIVILDANTLEVVEQATHEMEVTFPYIPGLFSFREIPAVKEAFKKLKIKPDLIVCDAQGIAHPMGVGMATHLGIELDIPTIGCAKTRLVGSYNREELGTKRGDKLPMIFDEKLVGMALRTQDNINPLFVSIGHKISLETACSWVLKLSKSFRQPETTRAADHLVNQVLKERTIIDFMGDNL